MKTGTAITLIVLALVAGYVAADAVARHFAKAHGVRKYGGIFQYTPPATPV